ncbi:MAG: class A beta-lactamase-related serine hydrolase [Candidatus Omnitrophica bacterium]|jgi:beta-lactamase class A|nr:class A beta-lactamase-related serine hydrolase [Candidatus Omnitrophota bacterium]
MKTKKIIVFILVICILCLGLYAGLKSFSGVWRAQQRWILYKAREADWQRLEQLVKSEISRFKGEVGIVIKDLDTGLEFSHGKDRLFPSASLAKIPVMAACFVAADQRKVKLDQDISLKSSDKLGGSGVLKDLPAGSVFSVEKLVGLMIYDSDNTAANIITDLLGIDYLNSAFKSFGLKNTDLSRKIADYRLRDKGIENYTTAEDMASLLEQIYRRRLGSKRVSDQCIGIMKLTHTNDRIPRYLPAEVMVAHKTGLENGVCHDAGIVFTCKGNFLICVLTRHSNPNSLRSKKFIGKVSLYTYRYFEQL